MAIINAMSLAQLQTTKHLLQEMEADGLRSLDQVRARLAAAIDQQHSEIVRSKRGIRSKRDRRQPIEKCPECGKPTIITFADGVAVRACRSCRWSALVEG